jgi:ParB family chromosome partitioning protein
MAKVSSRLGRGLGSLISGGSTPVDNSSQENQSIEEPRVSNLDANTENKNIQNVDSQTENTLIEVPLDQIVPNPYQPRKVIEPDAIRELAESISSEGLLQPIVARRVNDKFELVAGERRWRAHQLLEKSKILVRVLSTSDISSASLALIENLQREGLNPIEEAYGYYSLINEFNLTQTDVAERVGKSRTYITNLIRLLQLDDELKVLLSSKKISVGHAKVLLGIEDVKVRNDIGKKAAEEGWTVRQCEKEVESIKNPKSSSSDLKSNALNLQYANFAKLAEASLKRKVSIKSDPSGTGKISLNFNDESDLLILLKKLGVSEN